MQSLELDFNLA